jgi:hypothetical protein
MRTTVEFCDWLYELADHLRVKKMEVIEKALARYAFDCGFRKPPPRTAAQGRRVGKAPKQKASKAPVEPRLPGPSAPAPDPIDWERVEAAGLAGLYGLEPPEPAPDSEV